MTKLFLNFNIQKEWILQGLWVKKFIKMHVYLKYLQWLANKRQRMQWYLIPLIFQHRVTYSSLDICSYYLQTQQVVLCLVMICWCIFEAYIANSILIPVKFFRIPWGRQIDGRRVHAGRPKLTWKKLTEKDCRERKLTTVDPQERSTCRSGVRSAMRADSQLLERGPLMWMMPLHLHVNQKSDYDMI